MRAVLQRVREASVNVANEEVSAIGKGFLILLGIETNDTIEDIEWLCKKIVNMRVFSDANQQMNRNILRIEGDILLVSQFTLHALTKKGNRPSFIKAARPEIAIPVYKKLSLIHI